MNSSDIMPSESSALQALLSEVLIIIFIVLRLVRQLWLPSVCVLLLLHIAALPATTTPCGSEEPGPRVHA